MADGVAKIFLLDRLSWHSLVSLLKLRLYCSHIFYYRASNFSRFCAGVLARLGFLKTVPRPFSFSLSDARDSEGNLVFFSANEHIRSICSGIKSAELKGNRLLRRWSGIFGEDELLLFFEKIISRQLYEPVVVTQAFLRHLRSVMRLSDASVVFFRRKDLWSGYLREYAKSLNVETSDYAAGFNFQPIGEFLPSLSHLCPRKISVNPFARLKVKKKTAPAISGSNKEPCILSWYTGRSVTFDPGKRSDFFWALNSGVPLKNLLVYFDREDIPVSDSDARALKTAGAGAVFLAKAPGQTKEIRRWKPGRRRRQLMAGLIFRALKDYSRDVLGGKLTHPFYLLNLFYFISKYAYWVDFFTSHNVKVCVSPNEISRSHLAQKIALRHCAGVSVSYQWAHLNFSPISLSSGSDVMFSFSPAYSWVWENNHSCVESIVSCGYITDAAFAEVKERSRDLRRRLVSKGVTFVLAFFDENSSDDEMAVLTSRKFQVIYSGFIEKILDDPSLGLIFKPGYPKTLYTRLSPISGLLEKARQSQRCVFMEQGGYLTEQYPAEAALASDLCVGVLFSGTAALEASLSGRPTVFLDLEKMCSHPVYEWGRGKVVFDCLGDLFCAIEKYRVNPAEIPGFGDLSSWSRDKDCFKDGKASLRMGRYITWLYERVASGEGRQEALANVNARYRAEWGEDSVISCFDKERSLCPQRAGACGNGFIRE